MHANTKEVYADLEHTLCRGTEEGGTAGYSLKSINGGYCDARNIHNMAHGRSMTPKECLCLGAYK